MCFGSTVHVDISSNVEVSKIQGPECRLQQTPIYRARMKKTHKTPRPICRNSHVSAKTTLSNHGSYASQRLKLHVCGEFGFRVCKLLESPSYPDIAHMVLLRFLPGLQRMQNFGLCPFTDFGPLFYVLGGLRYCRILNNCS